MAKIENTRQKEGRQNDNGLLIKKNTSASS